MPKTIDYYVTTIDERMLATVVISIWRALYGQHLQPGSLTRLTGEHPISESQMQEARNTLKNLNGQAMTGRDQATDRDIRLWFDATINVIEALQRVLIPQ